MTTTATRHPYEEELLERCRELGLDDQDTTLLRDLLGWNNRNGGIPESYRGVEPQVSIASDATEQDKTKAQNIAQLVRRLIGDELMAFVNAKPIQTLQGQLGLQRLSVVWLVAQLRLHEICPEICDEIGTLLCKSPEQMPDLVVRPTLCMLLGPRQK